MKIDDFKGLVKSLDPAFSALPLAKSSVRESREYANYSFECKKVVDCLVGCEESSYLEVDTLDDLIFILNVTGNIARLKDIDKFHSNFSSKYIPAVAKNSKKKSINSADLTDENYGWERVRFLLLPFGVSIRDSHKALSQSSLKKITESEFSGQFSFHEIMDSKGYHYIDENFSLYSTKAESRSPFISKFNDTFEYLNRIEKAPDSKSSLIGVSQASYGRLHYPEGSASDLKYNTLFTLFFKLNGKKTSLIDLICEQNELLEKALEKLNANDIETGLAFSRASIRPKNRKSQPKRQLIAPIYTDNGKDYCLISPIPSSQVFETIENEKKRVEFESPFNQVRTIITKHGGSKPQNMGGYIMHKKGELTTLRSGIPKIAEDRSLKGRIESGQKILFASKSNYADIARPILNKQSAKRYTADVRLFLESLFSQTIEYRLSDDMPELKDSLDRELTQSDMKHGAPVELAKKVWNAIVRNITDIQVEDVSDLQYEIMISEITTFLRDVVRYS